MSLLNAAPPASDDCCDVPEKTHICQTPAVAAYNAPSCNDTCWNTYFTANFTYWSASEENLELAVLEQTGDAAYSLNGTTVQQNFDFAPGFQLGFGTDLRRDNWDFFAEYTWFRNTDSVTKSFATGSTRRLLPLRGKRDATSPRYLYGKEMWELEMDFLDADIGRTYYVGTQLTFRPSLGMRGAFIRQYLDVDYENEATELGHHNVYVNQTSKSWAIGPRAGIYSSWLVGKGMRLYGVGAGDLLFTRYTGVKLDQRATTSAGIVPSGGLTTVKEPNVDYLRAHLELELGLGWATYYSHGKYHFDFTAGYTFQVFFNQNMFRSFTDDVSVNSSLPNGDLFLQGLTLSTRFDY